MVDKNVSSTSYAGNNIWIRTLELIINDLIFDIYVLIFISDCKSSFILENAWMFRKSCVHASINYLSYKFITLIDMKPNIKREKPYSSALSCLIPRKVNFV